MRITCHKDTINRAIRTIARDADVVEIRIPDLKAKPAGYFEKSHFDIVADKIEKILLSRPGNVYIALNKIDPALLARAANRLGDNPKATVSDKDILRRRWVPIDVDPVRPSNISSTNAEKQAAAEVMKKVTEFLHARGFPEPVKADSGNGYHALYPVNLPNDEAAKKLIQTVLQSLSFRFDTDEAKVDTSVFNAARIWKLYGTVAAKGDDLADRPHRLARLVSVPDTLNDVPIEVLQEVADLLPVMEALIHKPHNSSVTFDIREWIRKHGIDVIREKPWNGGTLHVLHNCPFCGNSESRIVEQPSGAIGFSCYHNSCQGIKWPQFREHFEPGCYEKQTYFERTKTTLQNGYIVPIQSQTVQQEWPEPEPITESILLPVEPLSPDFIPEALRPWLIDISHRMQCPIEFVAIGTIVELSAVIGAGCSIRPKKNDDWSIIPNLWGGVVGRPSMLKTPSLAEVMKPLSSLECDAKKKNDEDKRFFDAKAERYKAEREALKQEMLNAAKGKGKRDISEIEMELASLEPPDEITRQRFKTNDSTVEKLGELLNENPRGVLVFRDELIGLLSSLDREDRQSDRAFYLEGWNGSQSFTTDRIGRGTIDVNNVCISVLGGIQPSKLTSYLLQSASNFNNDGMMQRFQLLVYPDEPSNWKLVDKKPDKAAKQRAYAVFQRIADMNFIVMGAIQEDKERPYFRFDDEAQQVFYEWLTELETKIRLEENPLMAEHLAKYRSLVPSLALIFHLIEGKPGLLAVLSVAMACEWSDFLEKHARRIYGLMNNTGLQSASLLAKKIQQGKISNGFAIRNVYRNCWHMLDTPELVEKACAELLDLNWIRETKINQTGGRPKTEFEINPKILP